MRDLFKDMRVADPFYVTTAISYPNGPPHIGHAYEAIAADVIARHKRAQGFDVFFQTGTDEHGLKMSQAARDRGVEPQALADEMSGLFRDMVDRLDVSYDRFIRTTEPAHHRASRAIWEAMAARGDIYLGRYEGWYSVRDEAFYDEKELMGEGEARLSPQGTAVEWTVEESWFFRLSAYAQSLLDHIEANPDFIRPESRRNEVLGFIRGGLNDLSISRTSFDWGVRVPGAETHVMYVWVDALTNYLTGAGYPDEPVRLARFWPADLHLIGKDIVRFHAVYWPAFLLSAGLALPKCIYGHGFLLQRGEKMSKSRGNVVDPLQLADRYGVDNLRYFLMRDVSFGQDGSYSDEAIVARCNAELANSFGNLAQRILSMIYKNLDGVLPLQQPTPEGEALLTVVRNACGVEMQAAMNDYAFSVAIEEWMSAVFACNQFVDAEAPWALRKTDPNRMAAVLGTLYVAIRDLAVAIAPITPKSAARLLDAMGEGEASLQSLGTRDWYETLAASGFRLAAPVPIFPRLDQPEA